MRQEASQAAPLTCPIRRLLLKVQLSICVVQLDVATGGPAAAGCMILTAVPILLQVVAHYDGEPHDVHCAVTHLQQLTC